jgi:hypothetical protein
MAGVIPAGQTPPAPDQAILCSFNDPTEYHEKEQIRNTYPRFYSSRGSIAFPPLTAPKPSEFLTTSALTNKPAFANLLKYSTSQKRHDSCMTFQTAVIRSENRRPGFGKRHSGTGT